MVYGHVSDSGGPTNGDKVNIVGDINVIANVGPTGNFAASVPLNQPYGTFAAQATDGTNVSNTVNGEFFP